MTFLSRLLAFQYLGIFEIVIPLPNDSNLGKWQQGNCFVCLSKTRNFFTWIFRKTLAYQVDNQQASVPQEKEKNHKNIHILASYATSRPLENNTAASLQLALLLEFPAYVRYGVASPDISDIEFSVVLCQVWLFSKVKQPSLSCYLTLRLWGSKLSGTELEPVKTINSNLGVENCYTYIIELPD